MSIQKLLKDCVNDQSLLTTEFHKTIIEALSKAFNNIFKLDNDNLMFTYKDQYTFYTKEAIISYRFKYGSMTVETMVDRIFVSCDIDVVALNVLNVPFNVVQFSLTFDNDFKYEYAYFTNHFYINLEKHEAAILHFEQRNYVDNYYRQVSGRITNVNNSFLDLSQHYGLKESYLSDDAKFIDMLYNFLNLQENKSDLFNEIFEEFIPYIDSMNSLHDLVNFLNLFSDFYYNYFELLEQKFLLFEMNTV